MKKTVFVLALIITLISCKKQPNTPVKPSNPIDTIQKPNDSVVCIDNSKINFTCVGTPIGKFSYCIKDVDGNVYKTVIIGKQQWMVENLKVSRYNDGTVIPNVKDSEEWGAIDSSAAWCYYQNDIFYNDKNGKLYNWFVVNRVSNGNKNVCPTGWRIPSLIDWNDLISNLKMEYKIDSLVTYSMKEIGNTSWISHNENASNTTLFTAIPVGYRDNSGYFDKTDLGNWTTWWSSTSDNADFASRFYIGYGNMSGTMSQVKKNGLPLRCLKDE